MSSKSFHQIDVRRTQYGKGVFSRKPFKKGSRVGHMTGRVVTHDNYDPDYVVDLAPAGVLQPFAPFRFLNHSCEPNCELVEEQRDDGKPQIIVYALGEVKPGEQLTIDYAWPAAGAIKCLCGAPNCRGWIVDKKQLKLLKKPTNSSNSSRARSAAEPNRRRPTASGAGGGKAKAVKEETATAVARAGRNEKAASVPADSSWRKSHKSNGHDATVTTARPVPRSGVSRPVAGKPRGKQNSLNGGSASP